MTDDRIRVRPAAQEDAAVLAELNAFVHDLHVEERPDVFRTATGADELRTLFRSFLARESSLAYLAESGGRAIGYVTATVHRRAGDVLTRPRNFAAIEHIAVDPAAARVGAGSALVEAVRVAAREAGCTSLVTDVWAFNKAAPAFFEDGLGFAPMRHWLEQGL
ncbi:GNAT family N-acetyltransferase [Nonomuraea sp. NPDC049709]|uniref:GNAT family N-acetyltransferase n=1 Tax=Nonomuraea sp. NPDC049709 TaxID=3154736 RepID=UPI0034457AFE